MTENWTNQDSRKIQTFLPGLLVKCNKWLKSQQNWSQTTNRYKEYLSNYKQICKRNKNEGRRSWVCSVRHLISLRDNPRKEVKRMTGMVWNKLKSLGFTPAVKYQKLERNTSCSHAYSCSYYTAPKYTRSRSRKRGWSKLVSGRWNGDNYKLVEWNDSVAWWS
jgi:hypothetical protein